MRYFVRLAYLGENYFGWQKQINAVTVQEKLEFALSLILRSEIKISGSSRTDTGVHAREQYAHFNIENEIKDLNRVIQKVNGVLPLDICIYEIIPILDTCHSRFDAVSRSYSYKLIDHKDPFLLNMAYKYHKPLDINKMNEAALLLLEYTDFQCFSRVNTDVATFNCTIFYAYWEKTKDYLEFNIKANRFLRGMVRAIVGTLLDVGSGKLSTEEFEKIIQLKDRTKAGGSAPAAGLTLMSVSYPENYFELNKIQIG
jgi:tRNA pseudouridine38-40 synthase